MLSLITYVTVETAPVDGFRTAMSESGRIVLEPWAAQIRPPFAEVLNRLVNEDFDGATCEAPYCPSLAVGEIASNAPVGYTLAGDADEYQRWHYTALVRVGDGPVLAVCEDCDPAVVYARRTAEDPRWHLVIPDRGQAPVCGAGNAGRRTMALDDVTCDDCKMGAASLSAPRSQ